jgi:Ca2+-binding EF-hand superfamily protein
MVRDDGRYHRQKRELHESQLSEIHDSFDLFDQDNIGTVQAKDLVRARRSRPLSPSHRSGAALNEP